MPSHHLDLAKLDRYFQENRRDRQAALAVDVLRDVQLNLDPDLPSEQRARHSKVASVAIRTERH